MEPNGSSLMAWLSNQATQGVWGEGIIYDFSTVIKISVAIVSQTNDTVILSRRNLSSTAASTDMGIDFNNQNHNWTIREFTFCPDGICR